MTPQTFFFGFPISHKPTKASWTPKFNARESSWTTGSVPTKSRDSSSPPRPLTVAVLEDYGAPLLAAVITASAQLPTPCPSTACAASLPLFSSGCGVCLAAPGMEPGSVTRPVMLSELSSEQLPLSPLKTLPRCQDCHAKQVVRLLEDETLRGGDRGTPPTAGTNI